MKLSFQTFAVLCLLLASGAAQASDPPISSLLPPAGQPAPAAAPEKPKISVRIDPALQQQEGAYKNAVGQLTPEQQAVLKDFQAKFLDTVTPEAQLAITAKEEQYCEGKSGAAIAKDRAKYQSELGVLRNQLAALDKEQRAALREKRLKATPFIDAKLVDDHEEFMAHLTLGMAEGAAQLNYNQGAFAKTDCAATAKNLDDAFAVATAPAPKAAPEEARKEDDAAAAQIAQIKKSAAKGDPEAMLQLATMQISGTGMPKNVTAGFALMQRAAETGYDRAEYILGLGLTTDIFGQTPDKEKAKYWLGKAAAQGNKKAADVLKNIDNLKPTESLDSLRARAAKGEADAEYQLGSRYSEGLGVEKDPDQALKWLLKAAGQGDALAESDVALLLINANRVAEGVDWMTKAANKGVTNSQYELAGLYLDGKVVPKDQDKAVFWYKKAADGGDSRAKQALEQLGKP